MKRPIFETDEVYHIYNRGVEKRNIFLDKKDYFRFIHDLYEFNDEASAVNAGYYSGPDFKPSDESRRLKHHRERLVDILCFCLMPNHYHLLVKQRVEGGITKFTRKLGTGYTNYFNIKNDRVGALFQGKVKAVHVSTEAHLTYLPHYIHLNPLDLMKFKNGNRPPAREIMEFLKLYRWSSYQDYAGIRNFPSIIDNNFILSNYGSPTSINYQKDIEEWIEEVKMDQIMDVAMDYDNY